MPRSAYAFLDAIERDGAGGGAVIELATRPAVSTCVHDVKWRSNTHLRVVNRGIELLQKSSDPAAQKAAARMSDANQGVTLIFRSRKAPDQNHQRVPQGFWGYVQYRRIHIAEPGNLGARRPKTVEENPMKTATIFNQRYRLASAARATAKCAVLACRPGATAVKTACSLTVAAAALLLAAPVARASCDEVGRIQENTVLFHGSPAALFDWRHVEGWPRPPFRNPNSPDGPAWFAFTYPFSLHAGLRYLIGTDQKVLTLHKYKVKQRGGIAVLICDNHDELGRQTKLPVEDDVVTAQAFCNKYKDQYNAYRINADRVRKEPELIVCRPGEVLQHEGSEDWHTNLDDLHKFYMVAKMNGVDAIEAYALNLAKGDLADFKKVK
jgi:hypothetical protein